MKALIVYSSRTGNTKMVADAILEIMPQDTEIFSVEEAPNPDNYDFVVLGFWADRGNADSKAQEYIKKIHQKKVAVFGTLGAYPDSDHAKETMLNVINSLRDTNEVLGEFICQGKVDPKLIERFKSLPPNHPHGMTEERRNRLEEASKHPNLADLEAAQKVFLDIILNYK